MHADQDWARGGYIALYHEHVFGLVEGAGVDHDLPGEGVKLRVAYMDAAEEFFGDAAVGDEVGDGAEFQAVALREGDEVRQAGHAAVFIHDLANDARGDEAGHAGDVNRRFGVAGAEQRAARTGGKRENMAGGDEIVRLRFGVDGDGNGVSAVAGGNGGGDALASLEGDGESCLVTLLVGDRHHGDSFWSTTRTARMRATLSSPPSLLPRRHWLLWPARASSTSSAVEEMALCSVLRGRRSMFMRSP
jgi:hypothetical protein